MEELKEILLNYDIAGVITIHTPGHAEYLNHITPSYSCAKINELTGQFELKAAKVHFSNEAERLNKLTDTCNMLTLLSDVSAKNVMKLIDASDATDKFLNAEHDDDNNTSHTAQNN